MFTIIKFFSFFFFLSIDGFCVRTARKHDAFVIFVLSNPVKRAGLGYIYTLALA